MKNRFSPSRLKTYDCPYRYRRRYIDGVRVEAGEAAQIGRDLHAAIAADLRREPYAIGHKDAGELYSDWLRDCKPFIDPSSILSVEEPLEHKARDYNLLGIPDLITDENGVCIVWDWKTDRRIRTSQEVEGDEQLLFYAALCALNYPYFESIKLRLVFVRYESFAREFNVSRSDALIYLDSVKNKIRRIESDTKYKAIPGVVCDYCEFWQTCPAMQELGVTKQVGAEELAARLSAINKAKKEAEAALKTFANEHGAIEGGGRRYEFKSTVSWKTSATAKEILERLPDMALELLAPISGKTLSDNARAIAALESIGAIKAEHQSRWCSSKV